MSHLLIYCNISKVSIDGFIKSLYIKSCNINAPAFRHNQHFLETEISQYLWFESATFGVILGLIDISASILFHIIIINKLNSGQDVGKKQWWIKIPRLKFGNVLICSRQENWIVLCHLTLSLYDDRIDVINKPCQEEVWMSPWSCADKTGLLHRQQQITAWRLCPGPWSWQHKDQFIGLFKRKLNYHITQLLKLISTC